MSDMKSFMQDSNLLVFMMEVASASGMLVHFYQTTQHNNPEDRYLQITIFVLWKPLSYFIAYAAGDLNH
jgi:hypothetical protein